MTIRPATVADDARLAELDVAAADPGTFVAPPRGGAFFGDTTLPADVLVAEIGGVIAGYVKVRPATPLASNAHVQQIQGLAVDPAVRRRGVARALLDAARALAASRGARKLSLRALSSNPGALTLYHSAEFAIEGVLREEFRLDDGTYVDDIVMACPV